MCRLLVPLLLGKLGFLFFESQVSLTKKTSKVELNDKKSNVATITNESSLAHIPFTKTFKQQLNITDLLTVLENCYLQHERSLASSTKTSLHYNSHPLFSSVIKFVSEGKMSFFLRSKGFASFFGGNEMPPSHAT